MYLENIEKGKKKMDSLIYSLNATVPIFAVIFLSYLLKQRELCSWCR